MERLRPGDIILLSRLYLDRTPSHAPLPELQEWYRNVATLAHTLAPKQVQLIVVGPPPIFQFETVGLCRTTGDRNVCAVPRAPLAAEIALVEQGLESMAHQSANIHLYQPFRVLCPEQEAICVPARNGTALFIDNDHLNSFGARSLAPDFTRFLLRDGLIRDRT
jgi:hypothetical protein